MKYGLNESLIDEIVNIISKYREIEKAVIFGSRARGDFKYNSDIDIAIYINSEESLRGKLLSDLNEINTLYKFDIVEVKKLKNENLIQNIIEQGIEIYKNY